MVGYKPAVDIHLPLWYVVLVCQWHNVYTNYVDSVHVGGCGGLSENCELCPVGFLVVGESPSDLL